MPSGRCGRVLGVAERVAGLETHARLEARIGIATGVVVVGDLIGIGEAQERGVVGETPNLAARMQELAPPGGGVIAECPRPSNITRGNLSA